MAAGIGLGPLAVVGTPIGLGLDHLFLGTQQENILDMISKNRQKFRSNTKITLEIASKIRESNDSLRRLAAEFNVSYSTIYFVKTNRTWRV